jgi:hypothetical protein
MQALKDKFVPSVYKEAAFSRLHKILVLLHDAIRPTEFYRYECVCVNFIVGYIYIIKCLCAAVLFLF